MITIGQRVKHAIDDIGRGEFEVALEHASIAIDITSKRKYGRQRSGRVIYKDLLKEYSWLLELMALGGIDLEKSVFGNYPLPDNPEPSFADLMYHVVRCGLVHEEGLPDNFAFVNNDRLVMAEDHIELPTKVIWALLGIVVFCPANSGQKTGDGYWLSIFDKKFVINESWGREDLARAVYEERKPIRVALNWPKKEAV